VHLSPFVALSGVQRNRGLVALGDLQRCPHVAVVPVRADHRHDLTVADSTEHGRRVRTRVDDDDLFVVSDKPAVDGRGHLLDPRVHAHRFPSSARRDTL
jgi:hypothetical protein